MVGITLPPANSCSHPSPRDSSYSMFAGTLGRPPLRLVSTRMFTPPCRLLVGGSICLPVPLNRFLKIIHTPHLLH